VRDTEDREGTILAFGPQAWRKFTAMIQNNAGLVPHPNRPAVSPVTGRFTVTAQPQTRE
jgi:Domain of unknown function (DUF397)